MLNHANAEAKRKDSIMDNPQAEMIIMQDEGGTCYLIPRNLLEQGRADPEQAAQLEQALAGDTSGFIVINWSLGGVADPCVRVAFPSSGSTLAVVGLISVAPR